MTLSKEQSWTLTAPKGRTLRLQQASAPRADVVFSSLAPREEEPVRGAPETLAVPEWADRVVLVLSLGDLRTFPTYDLEMSGAVTGIMWTETDARRAANVLPGGPPGCRPLRRLRWRGRASATLSPSATCTSSRPWQSTVRLLRNGKLLPGESPVPLEILVARVLDRFRGLYGEEASELLRPSVRGDIESAAARVPLLRDCTCWVEVRDYSARTGSDLLLGGKVGHLVYGEEAARFYPILRAGEILHLGKNVTSGCGRIRVDRAGEHPQ